MFASKCVYVGRIVDSDRHHWHADRAALAGCAIGTGSVAAQPNTRSNMRQVGLAIRQYCDTHHGFWPLATHTVGNSGLNTGLPERLDLHDCALHRMSMPSDFPDDPNGDARMAAKMTSYALNGYLSNKDGVPPGVPCFPTAHKLKETSKTIVMFELSDSLAVQLSNDHVHCFDWFSKSNIAAGTVWNAINAAVTTERHGDTANYLYADGHVDRISSAQFTPGQCCLLILHSAGKRQLNVSYSLIYQLRSKEISIMRTIRMTVLATMCCVFGNGAAALADFDISPTWSRGGTADRHLRLQR